MKKKYLLTPGPVECSEAVLHAESARLISHRCAAFSDLFTSVERKLCALFDSEKPVVILPSSGTGALECAAVNYLRPGDKFISLSCGVFGDRFREIASRTGAECIPVDAPLGTAPSPEAAAAALAENPDARAILITHNETSAGVTVPVKEIIEALPKATKPLILVDGVSSVGAIEILPEKWGVDVLCTASQKGLMTPPGLGLLWLSDRALSELENRKCPSYYFDLKLHLKHMKPGNMANPYTPPVSLYYALDAALDVIVSAGCDKWFAKRRKYADAFAAGLEAMGYELFVKEKALRSAGLTAFSAPGGRCEDVRKKLSAAGFETAGGQGDMKGKLIRAAHYSDWDFEDMKNILRAFAEALGCTSAEYIETADKIYNSHTGEK